MAMLRMSYALLAGLSLLAISSSVQAAPVHKCVVDGVVTFQQGPCTSSQTRKPPSVQELNDQEQQRRAAAASAPAPKRAQTPLSTPTSAAAPAQPRDKPKAETPTPASSFRCDGRQYCSQMTSCAEAKYFLANCPAVKMDGDKNGIPCEKQWCHL